MSDDGSFQRIVPHLWFDDRAEEAAGFYTSLFEDAAVGRTTRYGEGYEDLGRSPGSAMTVEFEIGGHRLVALNGGPQFSFTPAISLFVACETEAEVQEAWNALSEGGTAMMPLDAYEWSELYGWVQDRYGLTWQLSLGDPAEAGQKVIPFLMFVGDQHGRAEEAVTYYTSVFDDADVGGIDRYGPEEDEPEGTVKHARFRLEGQQFMAMESSFDHGFTFNEAVSLLVECRTQEEVDRYWDDLGRGGDPDARQCGWLKDRFGVSWQVCPAVLQQMLRDPDPAKVERVTEAFLPMEKLDIGALERAYRR